MSETIRIVVNVDDAKALSALGNLEAAASFVSLAAAQHPRGDSNLWPAA